MKIFKSVSVFLVFCFCLLISASAQTLASITINSPTTGFELLTTTSTAQMSATCYQTNGSTMTCPTLTWGSTIPADFTVNSSGLATGAGSTSTVGDVPDVFAYNGAILGHHKVYVGTSTFSSLTTRPEDGVSNIVIGTTVLVSAVADTSSDNTPVGDYCAYTSSNTSVATVNTIGEVIAVGAGNANITCTVGSLSVVRAITVTNPTLPGNTYYYSLSGGTRYDANNLSGQCNGLSNANYPGSGVNQSCAFNNPMWCFTDNSSTSSYTGAVQAGDKCVGVDTGPYNISGFTTSMNSSGYNGSTPMPSGTPANPTQLLGANYASCTAPMYGTGNRTRLLTPGIFPAIYLGDTQNVTLSCIDLSSTQDCNQGLTGIIDFNCPNGQTHSFAFLGDTFSANIHLINTRIHGYTNAWTGTPGPGMQLTGTPTGNYTSSEANYLDGWNFDDPYGFNGNRTDGLAGSGLASDFAGCTEEQVKTVTSVSRSGSGTATVVFPSSAVVNYVVNTNMVLAGMTPSDLNGTYPVSAVTFNQQSVTITGGSIGSTSGSGVFTVTLNTGSAPAFSSGSFISISGASPSYLNGTYEVNSVSGSTVIFYVSLSSHPTFANATITSGGTAATANTVTITGAGSSETATVVGTASHVHPVHRCFDQNDGGYANGDGVGTGNNTIGAWSCIGCRMIQNTQDGWDMLHSAMTSSTLTNTISEGNEGAPAKFGNADYARMTNNVLVANAGSLIAFDPNKPPDYNQYIATPYRAGDGLVLGERAWSNMVLSNNTWDVGQATIIDDFCQEASGIGCSATLSSSNFIIQNNNFIGFLDTNSPAYNGSQPGIYYAENGVGTGNPSWNWLNNFSYNARNSPSGGSGNNWSSTSAIVTTPIPNIASFSAETNAVYPNWNMTLTSTSPEKSAGISNSYTPATDILGYTQTNPATVGPYIYYTGTFAPGVSYGIGISGSGYSVH